MKVAAHILCFNEEEILRYSLRHYGTFCEEITIHDGGSTDGSRVIAREYGAEVRDFISDGVNDKLFKELKESCWKGTDADWVITTDADEFIYFPEGPFSTLETYDANEEAIIKTRGYEMFSDNFPTTEGQIYSVITQGAPDFIWYSKPVLFAPKRIKKLVLSAGCHTAWVDTVDGRRILDPQTPTEPPTLLLHFHHIGGIERITRRYAGQQSRHSEINKKMKWGNFKDPRVHCLEKRNAILAKLQQVIT